MGPDVSQSLNQRGDDPGDAWAVPFPIFIKLAGRKCLVVGAGDVAERKIVCLLGSGANVHIVAPNANDAVIRWSEQNRITWHKRRFKISDLHDVFVVIAATSSQSVNETVFRNASARRILCNVVDDPARCDFYSGAVVRRGVLQIAISTNGASPALAQRLREELESRFGAEYELWVERLARTRQFLFRKRIDAERRRRLLHRLAEAKSFERFVWRLQKRREKPE